MKILLLGAGGQVGWELQRTLSVLGELVTAERTPGADIVLDNTDLPRVQATLDAVAPNVIVNASAHTAVDRAEEETELASQLNAELPGLIGRWAAQHRARVLHYSTDYVFDGAKDTPYVETDPTCPISVYGRTKLAGDAALLASGGAAVILRVSWVHGLRGHTFLLTMRRLMAERAPLRIVDDQIGAPTWCRTIAQVSSNVLSRVLSEPEGSLDGVYHCAPRGSTSWFGFATAIRDQLGLSCELEPIPTSAYPTPAARPPNSRMDASRLEQAFGLTMPTWDADLRRCLATS